ncbi:MAG: geranylgeranyl reductase family protein [Candidatus Thorarchaeota archaeon]
MKQSYDVAVVGAGPAGSTVSKVVANQGFATVLCDRRSIVGQPVQCGELIPTPSEARNLFPRSNRMPSAVKVPVEFVTNRTHSIRLVSPNGSTYEFPFEANIVDRSRFDQYVAQEAVDAGTKLQLSTTVFSRSENNELITKRGSSTNSFSARVVVGADGANSVVARSLGEKYVHSKDDLSPSLQYVMSGMDIDESVVKMYFGDQIAPGGYSWVIPKGKGLVNVGFGMRRSIAKDDTPLRTYLDRFVFKTLASSAKAAKIERRISAIIPVGGPLEKTWHENTLLVGDAAGHVMASNGGGIPTALCGGEIAGDAIESYLTSATPLSSYEDKWRSEFGEELITALRVLRIADNVMPSDFMTDLCMRLAGVRFLEPLIRCRLPLPVDLASKTMVKVLNQFF